MAETTEALQAAISHWQRDAATGGKEASALRTSMRALAANIDTSHPSHLSGEDKLRLHGKLELMAHAIADAKCKPYQTALCAAPNIETIA